MAILSTEALILKAFNWSESSRTVHLLTKRFGKIALVDKGGRSIKSRRGRLMSFATLEISFYASEKTTVGHLSTVEIKEVFDFEADGMLGRLAYASAACELLFQLLPDGEEQPENFDQVVAYLRLVNSIEKQFIPSLFITYLLHLISQLGFHPALSHCVGCSKPALEFVSESQPAFFTPERGGIICATCQKPAEAYIDLPLADLTLMNGLQRSSLDDATTVVIGYQHATRIVDMLGRFLGYQADIKPGLKSLEFLEKLKNSQLNG